MHELRRHKAKNSEQRTAFSEQGLLHAARCTLNADRRRKGLSIIEVAMASVLLIVAMVPILRSLTKAHMYSAQVTTKTQSLILAQGKLDELRARSIYDFNSLSSPDVTLPSTSYLCSVSVTATANPDLKQITVSVGPSGGGVEVTLATCFARRW